MEEKGLIAGTRKQSGREEKLNLKRERKLNG